MGLPRAASRGVHDAGSESPADEDDEDHPERGAIDAPERARADRASNGAPPAAGVDPADSTEVGRMVHSLLSDIGRGEQIVVLRADEEVTPAEAARMIGVTRQFVDRLCEDGGLPYRRLPSSRHRRIRVADVVAVIEERQRLRHGHAALVDALTEAALATD